MRMSARHKTNISRTLTISRPLTNKIKNCLLIIVHFIPLKQRKEKRKILLAGERVVGDDISQNSPTDKEVRKRAEVSQ